MKIKYKYALRQIAGTWIVFSLEHGEDLSSGVLSLNESGLLLWRRLEQGCDIEELAKALADTYELPIGQAIADATEFIDKLRKMDCIEE